MPENPDTHRGVGTRSDVGAGSGLRSRINELRESQSRAWQLANHALNADTEENVPTAAVEPRV